MNTNANPIEFGAINSTLPGGTSSASPTTIQSEISNFKSETPESAFRIPQSQIDLALAHAERSYPAARRPKSPSHAKLYDNEKQRCFQERLRIETEIQQQRLASQATKPPLPSLPSVPSGPQLPHPSAGPSASVASAESAPCAGSMQNQPLTSAEDAPPLRREPAAYAPTAHPTSADAQSRWGEAPAEPSSSTTHHSHDSSPAEPPQPIPPPQNPPPPENPHANDPVFHYMMETNAHFRQRHQSIEKIRAKLNSPLSDPANSTTPTRPSAPDDSQPSSPIPEFLDPRSPLDQLSPERRRLLFEAIDEFTPGEIAAVVSKPEPEGWSLKTSERSLRRFWNRYRSQIHSHKSAETQQLARDLLANPGLVSADLDQATDRLFKSRLFQSLSDPKQPAREIDHLLRAYTRLRALELAERKQRGAGGNGRAATGAPT